MPAYVTPATAVVGQPADIASWWNDYVRDNMERVAKPPRCRVYRNVLQTIGNAANTFVSFNAERYDMTGADAMHSTSVNPSRITIVTAGVYEFGAAIEWASNATGRRQLTLLVNNTTPIAADTRDGTTGAATRITLGGVDWEFAAGDYVEVQVLQSSGGNLDISASTGFQAEFWCRKVSE